MKKYIGWLLTAHKEKLVIVIVAFLFLRTLLLNFSSTAYPFYDVVDQYSFWRWFTRDTILRFHVFPLWNPYVFSGSPFIANPLTAVFYPINLLYFITPSIYFFHVVVFIDLSIIGISTCLFAKKIGLSKWVAALSGIIFMLSGSIVVRVYAGHMSNLDTITWVPCVFLCLETLVQKPTQKAAAYTAIFIGLTILAGNIQFAFYGLVGAFLYTAIRLIQEIVLGKNRQEIYKVLVYIGSACAIGIGIASIQLFPSLEFSRLTNRLGGVAFDFASSYSLPPLQLISFIVPGFFGVPYNNTYWGQYNIWELCGYVGIIPLIMTFVAMRYLRNKYLTALTVVCLFSLLFSLGRYTPLFYILYHSIPLFKNFRIPATFLFVYAFAISIIGGYGIAFFTKKPMQIHRLFGKYVVIVLMICLPILIGAIYLLLEPSRMVLYKIIIDVLRPYLLAFVLYPYRTNHNPELEKKVTEIVSGLLRDKTLIYAIWGSICQSVGIAYAILWIFVVFVYWFAKRTIKPMAFRCALVTLVLIDLFLFSQPFIAVNDQSKVFTTPPYLSKIHADKDQYRIFTMNIKSGYEIQEAPSRIGLESVSGYDVLYLKKYQEFIWSLGNNSQMPFDAWIKIYSIEHPIILRLLNTKYLIANRDMTICGKNTDETCATAFTKKYDGDGIAVYEVKNPMPRAFFVPNATVIKSAQKTLEYILSPKFDPTNEVVIESKSTISLTNPKATTKITQKMINPNEIIETVRSDQDGYLVVSEIWYPGWIATVDGVKIPILKGDYTLRALPLKKGEHHIKFTYRPVSFEIGAVISTIALLFVCGMIVGTRKTKTRYYQ